MRVARNRLDDVRVADLECDEFAFPDSHFDCIICADVLEHLRQPEVVLRKLRPKLTPDGMLVVSIPNVRNHTVVRSLLAGNWTYESAGLLDADHVRFFTRREIEKLLFRAGFEIVELRMVPGEGFPEWVAAGRPREISVGGLSIRTSSESDAAEFFAYQYLLRARPMPKRESSSRDLDRTNLDDGVRLGTPSSGASAGPKRPGHTFDSTIAAGNLDRLRKLAERCPWPNERPQAALPTAHLGWLADGARELLSREVTGETQLVVELGSWLGLSTRFVADLPAKPNVIAIDHWLGSPEHQRKPEWQAMLPRLYDDFLHLSWDHRDRIQPLRTTTLDGLRAIADAGLEPDLIFVDADHTYESVVADLNECRRLFPQATLTGDDYDDPGVQRAVQEVAAAEGVEVQTYGEEWRAWKLAPCQSLYAVPCATGSASALLSQRGAKNTGTASATRNADCGDAPESFGLTSIIVVTWNQLSYTQACIDSLRLRTDEPYELIVVDNSSTDGTVDYLRVQPDVRLIENSENRGFPVAVNQGLQIARGEQLLLLNNDTVLTTAWLRRMLDVLHSDPNIGLVGPTSNNVGSEQQIPVDYTHLNDLDGFAWDRRKYLIERGESLTQDTDRLIGFCLLIKRELFTKIGGLDERFGIGCFEDDDFCRRAMQAGYRAVIAKDSFVHHFGSVTFQSSGIDLAKLLNDNKRVFDEKWRVSQTDRLASKSAANVPAAVRKPRPEFILALDDDGNLLVQPNTIRLSGCLIVRNNEGTIRPCLESLRPWVDELIVVDTGSTDATPKIAEELGARVFHWAWQDSFSAARNISLEHARGEWIFWMDSDDHIPAECGRQLRALADGEHPEQMLGYVMQVHSPGNRPHEMTVVDHVKLFRNRPELQFEFRMHEQILPAIRRAEGTVAFTDIHVVHSGSDRTPDGLAHKLERDFKLLRLDLAENPDHPFVLFNLGMTHADCGQHAEAIRMLERCLRVSGPDESHVRKAYAILISSLMQSRRFEDAEVVCERGRKIFPQDKELLFRQAMLLHHFGKLKESAAAYHQILDDDEPRHFTSIDTGLSGFKARHNLALVYEDLDDLAAAEAQWQHAIKEVPGYEAGWQGLAAIQEARRQLISSSKL